MTDSASCSLMTFMPSGYNSRNLFAITYGPMYSFIQVLSANADRGLAASIVQSISQG